MPDENKKKTGRLPGTTPHSALHTPHSPPPVIGLLGGVAAGKSLVA